MSGEQRRARVASAIRTGLAELLRDLSDPRITAAGFPSVNHVELNRDMSIANVYVSMIGGSDDDSDQTGQAAKLAVEVIGKASGRMRGPLGRQLNLKRTPELRFFLDDGVEFREHLDGILAGDKRPVNDGESG